MLKEFKKFILRGNVVDLAVGIVVGSAFSGVVNSLVRDMITPILSAVNGKTQFADAYFMIHHSKFLYGDFLNAIVSFMVIAFVIFFLVVQPINRLSALALGGPANKKCPECLSSIPRAATRCMYCTTKIAK